MDAVAHGPATGPCPWTHLGQLPRPLKALPIAGLDRSSDDRRPQRPLLGVGESAAVAVWPTGKLSLQVRSQMQIQSTGGARNQSSCRKVIFG